MHRNLKGELLDRHKAAVELIRVASNFFAGEIAYDVPEQDLRIDCGRLPALPQSRLVVRNVRGSA